MNIYKCNKDEYEIYDPKKYPPCGCYYTYPPCGCRPPYPPPCPPPKPPKPPCPNHDNTMIQKQCQGDVSQSQGNQGQNQGDQGQNQGDQFQSQGEQSQNQGDLSETQGDQMQSQGDQSQTLGDLSETQGDSMQSQGDQSQTLGDLSETQGDSMQSQGDQSQTLGDQMQTQGDQTQGDLTQGDQMQSITGHGDQTQGEQTLTSTPTINTPVTVTGVSVNVTVCGCGECNCKKSCDTLCRQKKTALLNTIASLQLTVAVPSDALINFYSSGLETSPATANLTLISSDCLFTITDEDDTAITLTTDSLELLSVPAGTGTPDLLTLLLNYAQNPSSDNCYTKCGYNYDCCSNNEYCCDENIRQTLSVFIPANTELEIRTANNAITGFAYAIKCDILYLVDNVDDPALVYAVPLCSITGFNEV